MFYKHTQIGYPIIIALTTLLLILFFAIIFNKSDQNILIMFFVLLLSLMLFYSLTIKINETKIIIKFGFGIISKEFNLKDIKSSYIVKNHWYYGWGIRVWFWPYMWIYNISGFNAVEIKMKNGKTYRIGTNEPKNLQQIITQSIDMETEINKKSKL